MSTGGLGTVNWFIMSYHSTYNHWTLHHYHWVMVTGLTLCCHLTWLTTERWALPWTVGEQLPGVSSCRIGSEWQCGNTGNTGNPWQGQTKSWEAARAQGPAPAMGSLGLCPVLLAPASTPARPRVTRARPGQPQVCGQGCGGWCHSRHYELMSPCHNVTLHSLDNEAPRPLTSIMVVSSLITLKLVSVVSIGLSVEPLTGWFP